MKLHDLTPGQRFSFVGKHRGKVFEVIAKTSPNAVLNGVQYKDVATGRLRQAWEGGKTFRMDVLPVTSERVITLTDREVGLLTTILGQVYKYEAEMGATEELKGEINRLYLKIKGHE